MEKIKKTKSQLLEELEGQQKELQQLQAEKENNWQTDPKLLALEKALDTVKIGVTITDISGKILYTNRAEADMHGLSVEDMIGKSASMLGPFELWDEHDHSNKLDLIKNMKNWKRETLNVRKDGSLFPVQLISNVIKNNANAPIGVVTVCDDITKRKISEAKLLEREDKFKSIVEQADAIVFALNQDKIITYVSPKWEQYLGYPISTSEGRHICDFIHPEDIDMTINTLDQLEEFQKNSNSIEFRVKDFTNTWKWWTVNASCERGAKGEIINFICIGHDITERRWAEDELRKALTETIMETERQRKMASEASRLKTELLGIAAHDLKNPLTSIMGLANFIHNQLDEKSPVGESAKIIESSTQNMLKLINDLLETSAIDSGRLELKKTSFNLGVLVEYVANKNRAWTKKKNQSINISAPKNCFVEADHGRMEEIIENLVTNAIKYSPFDKTIWLNLKKNANCVILEVKDEGPGLTDEDKKHLFKRFQRLSAHPTGNEPSTGLGLSIAKQLIELHGGEINVDSQVGQGSTFMLKIPLSCNCDLTSHHLQNY